MIEPVDRTRAERLQQLVDDAELLVEHPFPDQRRDVRRHRPGQDEQHAVRRAQREIARIEDQREEESGSDAEGYVADRPDHGEEEGPVEVQVIDHPAALAAAGEAELAENLGVVAEPDPDLGDRFGRVVDVRIGERERDAVGERIEDEQQHAEDGRCDVGVCLPVLAQRAAGLAEGTETSEQQHRERQGGCREEAPAQRPQRSLCVDRGAGLPELVHVERSGRGQQRGLSGNLLRDRRLLGAVVGLERHERSASGDEQRRAETRRGSDAEEQRSLTGEPGRDRERSKRSQRGREESTPRRPRLGGQRGDFDLDDPRAFERRGER